ncbi:MAG: N-acetylmuramoyl-L-alanine amidase, partial [Planctomycetes bacterium]|nr:N-acetylmuramoyl-L-alanine amidase [Planctomycetota bacterium]
MNLRLWLPALAVACAAPAAVAQARPPITQYPAHPGNYRRANRTYVNMIVIHKAQGNNSAGWSANPAATSSSHYDVHKNGRIYQCVQHKDIAWHAGNATVNANSIGIEHGGYAQYNDTTEVQYRSSAQLVAYLCVLFRIPIDRRHIIGHAEVPHPTIPGRFGGRNAHWDPGPHWRWDYFMNLVRAYANGAAPAPSPAP